MHFVNPAVLFGLAAVSIPVIIHLFNFRRFRKVYFTNVRFLRQLKQETQKQSKLRHLIILFMRMLAVASLVIAFAQPYIPFEAGQEPVAASNAVSIFVDNSFSMEAVGTAGTLLDEAREKAKEIAGAFKPSDQFQILTNDFEGRHQHFLTRDDFLSMLEEIRVSPVSKKMTEILGRQSDMLLSSPSAKKSAFILSDFQSTAYSMAAKLPDPSVNLYFVPLSANHPGNVFIDSCWFDLPLQQKGQTAVLNALLKNKSGADLEKIPIKLEVSGVQKAVASADMKAGSSEVVRIPYTNDEEGIRQGVLQVNDYPVTYDDRFYFSYTVTSSIKALAINGKAENRFLNALFRQDSSLSLVNQSEKQLDYSKLTSFDLIILNELVSVSSGLALELKKFVENGGTLCFLPAAVPDLATCNAFLSSLQCPVYRQLDTSDLKVSKLNMESHLFRNVFERATGNGSKLPDNTELPTVFRYYPLQASSVTQTSWMMKLLNNNDFLTLSHFGKGQVFQFTVPLDPAFTDFPRQALFVPVMYNIALDSRPPAELYQKAATSGPVLINHSAPEGDRVFRLRSLNGDFEMIPEHQQFGSSASINTNGQVTNAGNYILTAKSDTIAGISFNYDRAESDLTCLTAEELEKVAGQAGVSRFTVLKSDKKPVDETLQEMNVGRQLWKYFIVIALSFLLAEVILLRLWKN